MKKLIFVLSCLVVINVTANGNADRLPWNDSIPSNPRYIFTDRLAHLDSITITPNQVHIGESILFDAHIVGLDTLLLDVFYVLSENQQVFLTRLSNQGDGRYTGTYQIPQADFGIYTQFRAVANTADRKQTLITGVFPGVEVAPRPGFMAELNPTSVVIGDIILFSAEVTGSRADRVDVVYQNNGQTVPISTLSLIEESQFKQLYQGEFLIPGAVPGGNYSGFVAIARQQNSEILHTAEMPQTVILDTDCASATIQVNTDNGDSLSGATAAIGEVSGQTDENGSITLTGLQDNTQQTVFVSAPKFSPGQHTITLSCLEPVTSTITLHPAINDCAQLEIKVSDLSSGNSVPVAGATVNAAGQSSITDEAGTAVLENLVEGLHTLITRAEDFVQDQREINLSCVELNIETITLEPLVKNCATLDILVTDSLEQPISGAQITLANQMGSTDSAGRLILNDIREDASQIEISASGFIPLQSEISLNCEEPVSELFVLNQCAIVEFQVFETDDGVNLPIAEASVTVTDSNNNSVTHFTDENGLAKFTQFDPGNYSYAVTATGFVPINSSLAISQCRTDSEEIFLQPVEMQHSFNEPVSTF